MNLSDRERHSEVKAIEHYLSMVLCDAPLKPELAGCIWNLYEMANNILKEVEQVETEFDEQHFVANEASHDDRPHAW